MSGILCFRNIGQLVQADASTQPGIRLRKNCALLVEDGRVLKILKDSDIKSTKSYAKVIDCQGRAVVPRAIMRFIRFLAMSNNSFSEARLVACTVLRMPPPLSRISM